MTRRADDYNQSSRAIDDCLSDRGERRKGGGGGDAKLVGNGGQGGVIRREERDGGRGRSKKQVDSGGDGEEGGTEEEKIETARERRARECLEDELETKTDTKHRFYDEWNGGKERRRSPIGFDTTFDLSDDDIQVEDILSNLQVKHEEVNLVRDESSLMSHVAITPNLLTIY